jgi:hypothetical protein
MKRSLALLPGLVAALTALAAACNESSPPAVCRDIPANGCPVDNGADACQDPTCAAVYWCQGGSWVLDHACPGFSPDAAPHPVEASADAGAPDVTIDAPAGAYGGPGCGDLQAPDCSLGTALACGAASDCCGCQDLFVCDNGGWSLWGECVDGGVTPH